MFKQHSGCLLQVCPSPGFLVLVSSSSRNLVVDPHGFSLQEQRLRKEGDLGFY